jgi:hypothetical protein
MGLYMMIGGLCALALVAAIALALHIAKRRRLQKDQTT